MRQREHDVKVGHAEQLAVASGEPALARLRLALGAGPIPAGNGDLSITCLMGSIFLWGVGPWVSMRRRLFRQVLAYRDSP
jgi:hypothetical protein